MTLLIKTKRLLRFMGSVSTPFIIDVTGILCSFRQDYLDQRSIFGSPTRILFIDRCTTRYPLEFKHVVGLVYSYITEIVLNICGSFQSRSSSSPSWFTYHYKYYSKKAFLGIYTYTYLLVRPNDCSTKIN